MSAADPILPSATAGGEQLINGQGETVTQNQMSTDGRYLVFQSSSANMVAGQVDVNGVSDIFVFDKVTNATELISHVDGQPLIAGDHKSYRSSISADGRYVAFASDATNLTGGVTGADGIWSQIYYYDRLTQTTKLVTHLYNDSSKVVFSGGNSPVITGDGRSVVFQSADNNLVEGFSSSTSQHIYIWVADAENITLVDHELGSVSIGGNLSATNFDVTPDGRYIAYVSGGSKLVSPNTNGQWYNVFRYDALTGTNLLVSESAIPGLVSSNQHCDFPEISDDGNWIVFQSEATNLISNYSGSGYQIYLYDVGNDAMTLASHSYDGATTGGNAPSTQVRLSGNGLYFAYSSEATNLLNGFIDGNAGQTHPFDLFLYDRNTGQNVLITHQSGSSVLSANSGFTGLSDISADGKTVLYYTAATDVVAGYQNVNGTIFANAYFYDRLASSSKALTTHYGNPIISANGFCQLSKISADGSTVAFTTAASDIISGIVDGNSADDVYIRNLSTGTTQLASRRFGDPSATAGGYSNWSRTSADGRYVVFQSKATNLVAGQVDLEGSQDVFLRDRLTNNAVLISRASGTTAVTGNGESSMPVISADGRYVAYYSLATDLVNGFVDNNGFAPVGGASYSGTDVYLFDRVTGDNVLVSHQEGTTNVGGNQVSGSFTPFVDYLLAINADGRYVTYYSLATNLVPGFVDANGTTPSNNTGSDIFVFDRLMNTNRLISHIPGSEITTANDSSYSPTISADGRYIAYWSYSYTLVPGMTAAHSRNIFVFDQMNDTNTLVSHNSVSATLGASNWSTNPAISNDGNFIVYKSKATNLIAGSFDSNSGDDIFLYSQQSGVNVLVSHAWNSATSAGSYRSDIEAYYSYPISNDGRYIAFTSAAQNLVPGFADGNGVDATFGQDIYLFDRIAGTNRLVSHNFASTIFGGNGTNSSSPILSGDGRYVAFLSDATNITSGFKSSSLGGNAYGNVYLYDRLVGNNILVSKTYANSKLGGDHISTPNAINADGSSLLIESDATNLIQHDDNNSRDVFDYFILPPRVSSLQINDGSLQRSNVQSMTISFDEPIFFTGNPADAFTLIRNGSMGSVQCAVSNQNSPNGLVTITFSGPLTEFGSLVDGSYSLTIDASKIKNIAALDGNGDGVAGDNWVSPLGSIFRLFGDANGDATVDATDFIQFRLTLGGFASMFDFDNDGSVSAADFIQFRLRFGGSV